MTDANDSSRVVISLRDVVEALDLPADGWVAYVHKDTGEVVTLSDEDLACAEAEEGDTDLGDLPDWQQEAARQARAVLDSPHAVRLPDKFDVHEWDMMEEFARARTRPRERDELLDAIHGKGAFRMFRSAVRRLRIEDEWHRFRDAAFEQIAKDFLDAHGLAYK